MTKYNKSTLPTKYFMRYLVICVYTITENAQFGCLCYFAHRVRNLMQQSALETC